MLCNYVRYLLSIMMVMNIFFDKTDGWFWPSVSCGELRVQEPVYVDIPVTLEFKPKAYSSFSTIQWYLQTGGIVATTFFPRWKPVKHSAKYTMYNAADGSAFYLEIAGNNVTKLQKVYVTFFQGEATEQCDSDTIHFKRQTIKLYNTRRQLVTTPPNTGSSDLGADWPSTTDAMTTTDRDTTSKTNKPRTQPDKTGSTRKTNKLNTGSSDLGTIWPSTTDATSKTNKPRTHSDKTVNVRTNKETIYSTNNYTDTDIHKDEKQLNINGTERRLHTFHTKVPQKNITLQSDTDSPREIIPDKVSSNNEKTVHYQWTIVGGVCILVIITVAVVLGRRKRKRVHLSAVKVTFHNKQEGDIAGSNESILGGPTGINADYSLDKDTRRPLTSSCNLEDTPEQQPYADLNP